MSAFCFFTYMQYAYILHVHDLHMDAQRRRRPYGIAVGGHQALCKRFGRLPPPRLLGNTATQLLHVQSSAAESGITTDAQVVQM